MEASAKQVVTNDRRDRLFTEAEDGDAAAGANHGLPAGTFFGGLVVVHDDGSITMSRKVYADTVYALGNKMNKTLTKRYGDKERFNKVTLMYGQCAVNSADHRAVFNHNYGGSPDTEGAVDTSTVPYYHKTRKAIDKVRDAHGLGPFRPGVRKPKRVTAEPSGAAEPVLQ